MDKEILRIVIIAAGLIVMMVMIFWSYIKGMKSEREMDFSDSNIPPTFDDLSLFNNDSSSISELDDFDIIPLGPVKNPDKSVGYFEDEDEEESPDEPEVQTSRFTTPSIIQFSLVANNEAGFNGIDLIEAFNKVGLEYGSMKIYERLDDNNLVDFGVACMVEPGTFPETGLEDFYCPGLVFFMQPGELENAQAVFDDFNDTIALLASELDGAVLDHQRQPLTEATVQQIHQSL